VECGGSENSLGGGLCCTNHLKAGVPLSRRDLSYGLCDGYAKSGVAVQDGDTDLDFCDLPVEVSRHQGLAEKLDAVHLGLDTASAVVSAPPSPQCLAKIAGCTHHLVSGDGPGARGLPRFGVFARRYDGVGMSSCNRVMAFARVIGPICGH